MGVRCRVRITFHNMHMRVYNALLWTAVGTEHVCMSRESVNEIARKMHLIRVLLLALLSGSSSFLVPSARTTSSPWPTRAAPPAASAAASSAEALALKEEMQELMQEVRDRGIDAPKELADDILEVAAEMDDEDVAYDWAESPMLGGSWRLLYTSSRSTPSSLP